MKQLSIHLEDATDGRLSPAVTAFTGWAQALNRFLQNNASLCLRLVTEAEMTQLNETYRGRHGATNVLSFCADKPPAELAPVAADAPAEHFLGDIAICADVVERERREQGKTSDSHWAHLFIHGTLHLLGYDHENDDDARTMESLETDILNSLNYPAPYEA